MNKIALLVFISFLYLSVQKLKCALDLFLNLLKGELSGAIQTMKKRKKISMVRKALFVSL
jgi:hypothetical protein